jgi:glycerol kinase
VAFVLAIDQGTTSSRALVVDGRGVIRGTGQVAFRQHFPRPGWVEHDPLEIWTSTLEAIGGALRAAGAQTRDLAAIGITNQRETVVAWDRRTGEPAGPAIVWQDRRTAAICEELRAAGHERLVQERTGLTIDPYFSGTKLAWLFGHDPELRVRARRGEVAAGTIDAWLLWNLSGGARHATDLSNASRTMLFDIHRARWDEDLCALLEIPKGVLPEACAPRSHLATASEKVLGNAIPVLGAAGDQQAALFGQGCTRPGMAKNTYGTGCFLLVNRGSDSRPSAHRLLTSLTASAGPGRLEYALEGSVFVAGSLVQWLRDELRLVTTSADIEGLALSVEDSGGVTIVPAFTGLGAPYWDAGARGAILGLTRGTTAGHIARAALEAIAFSSAELVEAMVADTGEAIAELRVDGGAAANDLLMQLQADLAGVTVVRPAVTETTALGAAFMAGIGAGIWANEEETASLLAVDRRFEPTISPGDRAGRLAAWRAAVQRVLSERAQ